MPNDMTLAFGNARIAARDCRPMPVCDPRPECPACGGLECLCRPRFFAGQLLTEEDLNRLDHYIVGKNRLHNRHLFGSGVVCGLEVVCSVCDPSAASTVVVKPGYALSPCGNDIVVCHEESVDVCDLINRCRPRRDDCVDPTRDRPPAEDPNNREDEDWVLAICYQERPSRGVTALRGSCGCGCGGGSAKGGCGCGGSKHGGHQHSGGSHAGCGCGGGSKTARTEPAARSGPTPPQCEPTVICESYGFAVYKVPPRDDRRQTDPGALIKRFICCLVPLFEQLQKLPPNPTPKQLQDWLIDFIATVREFLIEEGLYDCEVVRRLNAVVVPVASGTLQPYLTTWTPAFFSVVEIVVAVFQKCLCAALLPPCPPPEMSDCVPIATVKVTRGRCRVVHVCNIGHRRFLVTWPNVQYWLSWLPIGSTLRKALEALCCTPMASRFRALNPDDFRIAGRIRHPPGAIGAAALEGSDTWHPFTRLFAEALIGGADVDAPNLVLSALGVTAKNGTPLVSDVDLEFPGQAMLMHQVVAPLLEPLMPLLSATGSGAVEAARLEASIAELQQIVKDQQIAIEELRRR